jgi:hypothetical protein
MFDMSNVNIRIADQSDVLSIHRLMYEAFTPLRELGIDIKRKKKNDKSQSTCLIGIYKKVRGWDRNNKEPLLVNIAGVTGPKHREFRKENLQILKYTLAVANA